MFQKAKLLLISLLPGLAHGQDMASVDLRYIYDEGDTNFRLSGRVGSMLASII